MPLNEWQSNTVETIFGNRYPHGLVKTVLDVGCGLSMKSQYIYAETRVGVDISRRYLERAREQSSIGDSFVLVNADALMIERLFLPKSFDVVICFDVVEHLPKDDALELLRMCEALARVAVCIETPLGYVPQNLDITGFGEHSYQTHRCGWEVEEFIKMGYSVLVRDYTMNDVQRHTDEFVSPQIKMIDAIKRMDWPG